MYEDVGIVDWRLGFWGCAMVGGCWLVRMKGNAVEVGTTL